MTPRHQLAPGSAISEGSESASGSAVLTSTRVVLVLVLAAAVCAGLWQFAPSKLSISTPIVGTPTFGNFNYSRYFDAFYLVAVAFPMITIALYQLASRIGPLRRPSALLPFRLSLEPAEEDPPEAAASWVTIAARISLPALVVALEASASSSVHSVRFGLTGLFAGLGYAVGVILIATLLPQASRALVGIRSGPELRRFATRIAAVNSVALLLVVVLCAAVSATTNVVVAQPARVVHYPWLPWWLALLLALALGAWTVRELRRSNSTVQLRRVEGMMLAVIAGTALVFLAVASLPGALGAFGGFDDAQYLAGAQLTFVHGLLPWRDVYLLHGMIEDVFDGVIGFAVFSHSRWGAAAGQSLIVYPISYCIYYLFVVYFARRSRLAILIGGILIITGYTTAVMRFAYLPLTVMLLDRMLRSRRRDLCALFAALVVLEAILTPEMALIAIGLLATVLLFELVNREATMRWSDALFRTRWTAVFGALFCAAWAIYLVASRSFGAFLDYYRVFGSNHALWGAFPLQWSLTGDPRVTAYFVLPVVLELATIARFVSRIRRRASLSVRDWSMLAAASFVLLYFQKGLDRPDSGHIIEVFTVSMPLVLLWGIEALETVESALRRVQRSLITRGPRASSKAVQIRSRTAEMLRGVQAPVGIAVCIVLALALPSIRSTLQDVPGNMHASAPAEPSNALLGYTIPGAVNLQEISNLGKIIDTYTPPNGPVFDFTNEPGIVYYLLNRVPGSRFFHVEEAETPHAQTEVISELEQIRPHLVIFTDSDFGLPTVDGIVGPVRNYLVSQYILDNYRPFADDDGQLVMLRDDLASTATSVATLHLPGVVQGYRGLYFSSSFVCNWSDLPNFLASPQPPTSSVPVPISGGQLTNTVITGWAVDAHMRGPVRRVIAVSGGRVIGSAKPDIYRLDIKDYFSSQFGWTAAEAVRVVNAGFQLNLELKPHQPVQIYAINADASSTRILPAPPPSARLDHGIGSRVHVTAITTPDGIRHTVNSGAWLSGWVNSSAGRTQRVYTLRIDPKLDISSFRYIEITSTRTLGATFNLGDVPEDQGRDIAFSRLTSGPSRLDVPVGSCLAWHGYVGALQLIETGSGLVSTVQLGR